MATKSFTFDFFQVKCTDDAGQNLNLSIVLDRIIQGQISNNATVNDYPRDIYGIASSQQLYSGQLRKLRQKDLPEIGAIGTASAPLNLPQGQGVLERNCFVYDEQNSLLVWQSNFHGNTPKVFAEILSVLSNCRVSVFPLLRKDTYQRLLQNKSIKIKNLDIAVAKPNNPIMYKNNDPITDQLLTMLESTGADKLDLKLHTDLRKAKSDGFLSRFSLNSIKAILGLDPNRARITVIDQIDDVQYPIDLISDRLRAEQTIEQANLATIPASLIIDAAERSYRERRTEINAILTSIP